MSDPIKALFISHSSKLYGAQKSLLDLLDGMQSLKVDCQVLAPNRGLFIQEVEQRKIPYIIHPFKGWLRTERTPFRAFTRSIINKTAASRLARLLQDAKPDIIYTNSLATPIGALIAEKIKVPHIWHARESVEHQLYATYDWGIIPAMKFIDSSSQIVICNALTIRDELVRFINPSHLTVIYNGLFDEKQKSHFAPKAFNNESGKPVELCMVGSLTRSKGHRDAIVVLDLLKKDGYDVRLRLVGTGSDEIRNELIQLGKSIGVAEFIDWEGYSSDVMSLFASADVALVCSQFEAFGRVAAEAMAVGTPVVSSNSGGLAEVVTHMETGLLYTPGNVEELAANIKTLLSKPDLYNQLSKRAFDDVYKRFSRQRYTHEVYTRILQASGRTPESNIRKGAV